MRRPLTRPSRPGSPRRFDPPGPPSFFLPSFPSHSMSGKVGPLRRPKAGQEPTTPGRAMSEQKKNWITVTESPHPWERDALDFVRDRWPDHDPYRAWANFEFIALDGSINEVDLLLLTPRGFFLVEIKSRPGRVFGDPGTWTWDTEGRLVTAANPLLSVNLKAKKLRALLERQKAVRVKGSLPFIEPLALPSDPDVYFELW